MVLANSVNGEIANNTVHISVSNVIKDIVNDLVNIFSEPDNSRDV